MSTSHHRKSPPASAKLLIFENCKVTIQLDEKGEAEATYIYLASGEWDTCIPSDDGALVVDYSTANDILGIELLKPYKIKINKPEKEKM